MNYIIWRWTKGLVSYWKTAANFAVYFGHIFAIRLLLRTLYWPWKRDLTPSESQGFDIKEWFRRHMFNFFSRIIGLLIKSLTIIFWILLEIIWWSLAVIFYPLWILAPFIFAGLLYNIFTFALNFNSASPNIDWLTLVLSILVAIILVFIEISTIKARRLANLLTPDPQNPNTHDPWFISTCIHLLVDPANLKDAWGKDQLKNILMAAHLTRTEFDKITSWEIMKQVESARKQCFWLKENLFKKRPITEDWVYGWTFNLNKFSHHLEPDENKPIANINLKELEILKKHLG